MSPKTAMSSQIQMKNRKNQSIERKTCPVPNPLATTAVLLNCRQCDQGSAARVRATFPLIESSAETRRPDVTLRRVIRDNRRAQRITLRRVTPMPGQPAALTEPTDGEAFSDDQGVCGPYRGGHPRLGARLGTVR